MHDEFIGQVQHRAKLETLAERIADGAAKNLAAQFTGSLMTKVREQFPSEFDRLFESGSTGRMPASE